MSERLNLAIDKMTFHYAAPVTPTVRVEAGSPGKPPKQLLSESCDFCVAAKLRLQPDQADPSPAYEDGCLLRLLTAARVPSLTPSARLLFTEQDLVLQAGLQCSLILSAAL